MIIEFSVGNYRSFKEIVVFSMVAANINSKNKQLDEDNLFQVDDDLKLLKSSAIYGANASGKSNLASALNFMRAFVLNSSKETKVAAKISVTPFLLSSDPADKPSHFEIVFIMGGRKYRYGFEVDAKNVVAEWLFHVPSIREAKLFERHADNISLTSGFKEGKEIIHKTRNNALFLSVVAQFNGELSKKILRWFLNVNIISGVNDITLMPYTIQLLKDPKRRNTVVELIKKLDTGIADIRVEKGHPPSFDGAPLEIRGILEALTKKMAQDPKGEFVQVQTYHKKYNSNGELITLESFDFNGYESEGTKKLVAMSGPLIDTLRNGKFLFIDEIDARLHPLITNAVISLFNSKVSNPNNAQLVFITHDTNLLSKDSFRRDQIWFAEKDKFGATHLHSLVEYKIRNDASFDTDYINGKYGAIPFIGDLSHLVENTDD
ncbi:MAG: ATP-binding protein [Chloroflexi bacterium]|nr:ATP-binding protein [Chloroflexota bacterium]